jgi:excisionase family DNA binding protein
MTGKLIARKTRGRLAELLRIWEGLGMPESSQLLSSAEACTILQVSRSTLIRWVASGKIHASQKLPGQSGVYLFEPAEVTRLMRVKARAG